MGSLISIWGKGSSGKTTVAINTAIKLAKKDKLVCIIGASTIYGSLQRYLDIEISEEQSLIQALLKPTTETIKKCVVHIKGMEILIISLANSDNVASLMDVNKENVETLLKTLKNMVDYVIIDGTDRPNDILMFLGFMEADHIIEVVDPSIQGIAYHNAHQVLVDKMIPHGKYSFVFNGYKPYVGIEALLNVCEGKPLVEIPFSYEVETSSTIGTPVCYKGTDKKYLKSIDLLVEKIMNQHEIGSEKVVTKKKLLPFSRKKEA